MRFVTHHDAATHNLRATAFALMLPLMLSAAACNDDSAPTGSSAAEAVLAAEDVEVRGNQRMTFRLINTGGVAIAVRACVVEVQRASGPEWAPVAMPTAWSSCGEAERTIAPQSNLVMSLYVPTTLAAGTYRIACDVAPTADAGGRIRVYSTSFLVLA